MNLNFLQNVFPSILGPEFSYLDTALSIVAFVVLIILLPILVYFCQKNIFRCYKELKRQNRHLQTQNQCLDEMNRWLQYFNDKIIKREKVSPPEKEVLKQKKRPGDPDRQGDASIPPSPTSSYKKTI